MPKAYHKKLKRGAAFLTALFVVLSFFQWDIFTSYALNPQTVYQIGDHVTASLSGDGTLSVRGTGDTYDYRDADGARAPFYGERQLIRQIEIADGVASVGDYLFYNCENLSDTLILPASVVRIGEKAFSGDSAAAAPDFTYVYNHFTAMDSSSQDETASEPTAAPEPSAVPEPTAVAEPTALPQPTAVAGAEMALPEETPSVSENAPETAPQTTPSADPQGGTGADAGTAPGQDAGAAPAAAADAEPQELDIPAEPAPAGAGPQPAKSPVTQQEIGEEIFYPGRLGVFECAESRNQSFIAAAAGAGYAEILSWTVVPLDDGFGNRAAYAMPVTGKGAFLPAYEKTGLKKPGDARTGYRFTGWKAEGSETEVLAANSFCALPQDVLAAQWETLPRSLKQQTISRTAGTQLVEISGSLPEGAQVFAQEAELTPDLLELVSGALGSDAPEIFFALDIAVLVYGEKYQPEEYGESVTVNIRNVENLPSGDVSILHLKENDQTSGFDLVETLAPQSLAENTVKFAAESFSLYIAAKAAAGETIVFDLSQGPVTLGANYSGRDSSGAAVTGAHQADNYYVVTQSGAAATENNIKFEGDGLSFRVELAGVNISRPFAGKDTTDADIEANSSIFIPAYEGCEKHVTLYLSGSNVLDNIAYYTHSADNTSGTQVSASTLKITSAAGDGSEEGSLTIDATARSRYTCIGGTGTRSPATGLTLAGGTITAVNNEYEAAIGGGSNGYAEIFITGGFITATQATGNAPAIDSGSGGTAAGADARIVIAGGTVAAANQGAGGVAIGAGGSTDAAAGTADISISGGTVIATAGGKNAIGSGYSEKEQSYAAASVRITGGSVDGTVTGTPTCDGAAQVQRTAVTLKSNGAPQAGLAVDSFTLSSGAVYGAADVKTDQTGTVYLWLPDNVAVTAARSGIYVFTGEVKSGASADLISGTVLFDLAKGPVVLGETYSGTDDAGQPVTGTHDPQTCYIIRQSDSAVSATTNTITFQGNGLTFQVVLDSINVDRTFHNTGNDDNRDVDSSIYIPAYPGAEKHVTLYLSGENRLNTICYYTIDADSHGTGAGRSASTLKITSAAGDGALDGSLAIDATQKGRFSCIGATGDKSTATGLTIAGGTITTRNSGAEACIGGGSNGFAEIFITGGKISATQNGNAPAIGSGSGTVAVGADAEITISGGIVQAENISSSGVAIGAGGSSRQTGGYAKVRISGGDILATVTGGTGIGGGNSIDVAGGGAEVAISGGTVASNGAIGGGFSETMGYAGAAITVTGGSLNAMMSKTPTNGFANVYLTSATLYNADQRMADTAVDTISVAGYGMKDVRTDGSGTLYLWLPENTELTGASAGGNGFTGSVLAKYAGILKYNSAKVYYSVHFPYDDRFTVYADADMTIPLMGTQTVPAGDVLSFWVQAKTYDGSGHFYTVDAYRSADTSMTLLPAESAKSGSYAYGLTVTSNTELLFVTRAGSATPRLSLDISAANAAVDSESVTIGGYKLSGYTGDLFLTSGGLPTSHLLVVTGGTHAVMIDRLVAQRSGNVIQIDGGKLSVTASRFNNNLASAGHSAILVQEGAELDLSVSGTASLEISSSDTRFSPIGGSGAVNITKDGGFLTLSGGENKQITAKSYTYTTSSLSGALPYSVLLTEGTLAGYHDGSRLTAADAAHSVSAKTVFTACAVSYLLPSDTQAPAYAISENGGLSITLPAGTSVQAVKRDGTPLGGGEYERTADALLIMPAAAYGSLEITLGKEGAISYKAADYAAEYTGEEHIFRVTVAYPAEGANVSYSTDQVRWQDSPPVRTDVGSSTIYWKISADGLEEISGSNTFAVTKGTNQWLTDLTCPSVQYGTALRPNAQAKWGEVVYSYYTAADLSSPLTTEPTEAGSYYVKAVVEETGNYDRLESDLIPFTIETTVIYSAEGKILERLSTKDGVPISTAVTTAANGAFTVSYGFFYIPNSADTPLTLQFSEPLPKGTKLTMLDICPSHADKPRFFYYIVPEGGAASIRSTDFYQMGTVVHGTFENENAQTAREIQYQLCVEFPQEAAASSGLVIRLTQNGAEIDKTAVTVTRTAPSSAAALSLTAQAGQGEISAAAAVSGAADNSVIALSLLDGSGSRIDFPAGLGITLDGRMPSAVRSSFAAFDGIKNGSHTISVTGLPAGTYQLKADLCSAPENPSYPLADSVSEAAAAGLVVNVYEYALKAELSDGQSRVVNGEAGGELRFQVTGRGPGEITVDSQRKTADGYVSLAPQWEARVTAAAGDDPRSAAAAVTVPAGTAPGTYRLVFQLGDAQFPYNILVE